MLKKHESLENRGYTETTYWLNVKFVWSFTIACFVLNALSGERFLDIPDLAIITYGIPAVWTELGLHTAFVIWKAKAENTLRYNKIKKALGLFNILESEGTESEDDAA